MLVPLGAAPARPAGVAEIVRRLAEAEAKLQTADRDRAGDAELIGNMLAEIGERDRRLRMLEGQIEADADRIRALEIAESSQENTDDRVRALEELVAREDAVFTELLRRLSEKNQTAEPIPSELHELLAVTLSALDVTRTATEANNTKVEQILLAIRGGPEAERGLVATLRRGQAAESAIAPVDRAIARVVDRLREIERRERELSQMRDEFLDDAAKLIGDVRHLGTALGVAATPAERTRPPQRRRPPSVKFRR